MKLPHQETQTDFRVKYRSPLWKAPRWHWFHFSNPSVLHPLQLTTSCVESILHRHAMLISSLMGTPPEAGLLLEGRHWVESFSRRRRRRCLFALCPYFREFWPDRKSGWEMRTMGYCKGTFYVRVRLKQENPLRRTRANTWAVAHGLLIVGANTDRCVQHSTVSSRPHTYKENSNCILTCLLNSRWNWKKTSSVISNLGLSTIS